MKPQPDPVPITPCDKTLGRHYADRLRAGEVFKIAGVLVCAKPEWMEVPEYLHKPQMEMEL